MTTVEKIDERMVALTTSVDTKELIRRFQLLRSSEEARTELQKNLLALSFGCFRSGHKDASQHFHDAAGFLAGFGVYLDEQNS